MGSHSAYRSLIAVQISGFAGLIVLLWLDDILDFPKFLGISYESTMLAQTVIATVLCIVLSIWLTVHTNRTIKRLKSLEGLLPVCSFCKKIRVGEEWVAIEHYVTEHSDAQFSHGFCPDCGEKYYGDYYKKPK
jgi:hypothetical protein